MFRLYLNYSRWPQKHTRGAWKRSWQSKSQLPRLMLCTKLWKTWYRSNRANNDIWITFLRYWHSHAYLACLTKHKTSSILLLSSCKQAWTNNWTKRGKSQTLSWTWNSQDTQILDQKNCYGKYSTCLNIQWLIFYNSVTIKVSWLAHS